MAHALRYLRRLVGGLVALGFAGTASMGWAQPNAQVVRFTVFSAKPIAGVAFVPRANTAPQTLQFQPTARSARYEFRGVMPLRFIDVGTGAVIAEAAIPFGMRDALLLFTPLDPATTAGAAKGTPSPALRYQIAVLDDSASTLAPGGLAIINLSGLTLSGAVNSEKVALKAGLNPPLAIGRSAKVALATTCKNRTYQSYAATAALAAHERALLILFPPFYAGSMEVQSRLLIDQPPGANAAVVPVTPAARPTPAPPPAKRE